MAREGSRWCCRPSRWLGTSMSIDRQREYRFHRGATKRFGLRISDRIRSFSTGAYRSTPWANHNVIDAEIPFGHELLEITQAERISKIASDTENDDFTFKMPSLEQCRARLRHGPPAYQAASSGFATHPAMALGDGKMYNSTGSDL